MKKFILLLIFAALTAASTNIRLAHLAYNTTAVNLLIDGNVVANQTTYNTITPYFTTTAGSYHVVLEGSESHAVLYNETLAFLDLEHYTLFVPGHNDVVSPVLAKDDNSAPANQYGARLRLFQGVSDVATTAEIKANGNVVATLGYKDFDYVALPAGTYTIAFQPTGAPSPTNQTQINLAGGQVSTLAFSGLISDLTSVQSGDADYTYFSYRVAHLSPDVNGVDVYFKNGDGVSVKVVPNVAFKTITEYASFAALNGATYTAIVTPTNIDNDTLASSPLQITGGKIETISLVGLVSPGTTTPFHISFLTDNNAAPADSWTNNVRFFVAIPGTGSFTLLLNNQPIFTDVAYDQVPAYQAVQTGTYTLSLTSGGDQIATADVQIVGGGVYTIIADGLIGTNSTQKPALLVKPDATYTYFTVRATHAAPGVAEATFILRDVNGQDVYNFGTVDYGTFSTYHLLPLQASFVLNVQSGGNTIYNSPITFQTGKVVTLALFGPADSISVAALEDVNTAPSASTKARARFVNGIVNGATVDVKFNGANQFNAVAFKQASGYSEVAAGSYAIEVFVGPTLVLKFTQTLTGGVVYTIVAEGIEAPNTTVPVTDAVREDQTYQYFKLRVNHASSNAGPVDILLDNGQTSTTAFSNLQYQQSTTASDYTELVLSNSNVTFKVTPHDKPTDVIYSVIPSFVASTQYTATLYGLVGNVSTHLTASISADVNAAPSNSATGRIRFLHAIAGSSNIDVQFNDKPVFSGVAYGQLFNYTEVPASANYRIDLYLASGVHAYAFNNYQLAGGQDTLIVAMGTPDAIVIVPYVYVRYTYFQIRFVHTSPDAGNVTVSLEDQTIFSGLTLGSITEWREFTSDKKNLAVTADGETIIQRNQPFTDGAGNTVVLVGLKKANSTTPLDLIVDVKQPTVPTSNTVASIRVFHVSPNTPTINIKFNDTEPFTGIQYKQLSDYKEIAAGTYELAVWSETFNHSLVSQSIDFIGGSAYTVFVEGEVGTLSLAHSIDYVPPTTGSIRFLHASPNTEAVDLLVDGSSDFKNVAFEAGSGYITYSDGQHPIRVVPTDKTLPTLVDGQISVAQGTWKTVLLIGLQKTNESTNETAQLEAWEITDQHVLPAPGDVAVRFIHASPNAPSLDLRLNGQVAFNGVVYKNLTDYRTVAASFVTVEAFETGKTDALFTSKFDLSVPEGQSAVYTLVAEGLYGKDLKVVSFLDNGPTPPVEPSPSKSGTHGLSGAAIGGIVAGVVVAVIALVAVGYIVYRRRKRAGYSEIATSEHSA